MLKTPSAKHLVKLNCGKDSARSTGWAATAKARKRVDKKDVATMTATRECGCNFNKTSFYIFLSKLALMKNNLTYLDLQGQVRAE